MSHCKFLLLRSLIVETVGFRRFVSENSTRHKNQKSTNAYLYNILRYHYKVGFCYFVASSYILCLYKKVFLLIEKNSLCTETEP